MIPGLVIRGVTFSKRRCHYSETELLFKKRSLTSSPLLMMLGFGVFQIK